MPPLARSPRLRPHPGSLRLISGALLAAGLLQAVPAPVAAQSQTKTQTQTQTQTQAHSQPAGGIEPLHRYIGDRQDQVSGIGQFSDVRPGDWAYQALTNLIERYGCVAGYPNGTYRGGQAMTRYEAAALLNACLDRVTEVTDDLKRLSREFEHELAVLRGRIDGLEAKVEQVESMSFSPTTRFKGEATFTLGGNAYFGDSRWRRDVGPPYFPSRR